MSPIDTQTILEKLSLLETVINKLEKIKSVPQEDFFIDFYKSDSALHNLVLGIEIIVDIGNHILVQKFHSSAKTYKDVIIQLGKKGIIPQEFAEGNSTMIDFRNRVIHGYVGLDLHKVYDYLQKAPEIFRKFAERYEELIGKDH
jgi:uncharacterized protein YutE (UPF0331/DUF86 family)